MTWLLPLATFAAACACGYAIRALRYVRRENRELAALVRSFPALRKVAVRAELFLDYADGSHESPAARTALAALRDAVDELADGEGRS